MKNITLLFIILFSVSINHLSAQPWRDAVKSKNPTLGEVKAAFYDYWKDKPVEKGSGYKPFKRWEWFWDQRIKDTDTFPRPSLLWEEWSKYQDGHPAAM